MIDHPVKSVHIGSSVVIVVNGVVGVSGVVLGNYVVVVVNGVGVSGVVLGNGVGVVIVFVVVIISVALWKCTLAIWLV